MSVHVIWCIDYLSNRLSNRCIKLFKELRWKTKENSYRNSRKTLHEIFTKEKPNISNPHAFGTPCTAYDQKKSKLDLRSTAGTFVGYDVQSPAHILYLVQHKIKHLRYVMCPFFDKHTQRIESPTASTNEFPLLIPMNDLSPKSVTQDRLSGTTQEGSKRFNSRRRAMRHISRRTKWRNCRRIKRRNSRRRDRRHIPRWWNKWCNYNRMSISTEESQTT